MPEPLPRTLKPESRDVGDGGLSERIDGVVQLVVVENVHADRRDHASFFLPLLGSRPHGCVVGVGVNFLQAEDVAAATFDHLDAGVVDRLQHDLAAGGRVFLALLVDAHGTGELFDVVDLVGELPGVAKLAE